MSMTGAVGQSGQQPSGHMANAVSAMPFLARNPKSVWARSAELRDFIYESVETACRDAGVAALINKSRDVVYPAWVSLEAWLPAGAPGATRRRFCVISVDPKPYTQFEFELTIRCDRDGGESKTYGPFAPRSAERVDEWVRYMLDKGGMPSKYQYRIRKFPWQFWFDRNKVTRLGTDMLGIFGGAGMAVAFLGSGVNMLIGIVGVGVAVTCFIIQKTRKKIVINAGRPIAEPRTLRLADSWQTMVYQIGANRDNVRDRIFRQLAEGRTFNIEASLENISYLTADGKQEREQLVLSQGRGIVYCHVYQYGNDLFIAWEAFMNHGRWVEKTLASGFDTTLHVPAVVNTVTPGVALVTEYDLIDLNSLTEWVHSRVVKVIKQALAEHKLDQDIDFKIVRGERQSLLHDQDEPAKRRPLFSRGAEPSARDAPQTFAK